MKDIIAAALVCAILFAAIAYIVRAKKSGAKCIGCPQSKNCGSCGCGCSDKK